MMPVAALVDAVIVLTLLEGVVLVVWHRFSGAGVAPRDFALNMVSGLCLMLALRCAVRDGGTAWLLLFLASAGLAHGGDIVMRSRRR